MRSVIKWLITFLIWFVILTSVFEQVAEVWWVPIIVVALIIQTMIEFYLFKD